MLRLLSNQKDVSNSFINKPNNYVNQKSLTPQNKKRGKMLSHLSLVESAGVYKAPHFPVLSFPKQKQSNLCQIYLPEKRFSTL